MDIRSIKSFFKKRSLFVKLYNYFRERSIKLAIRSQNLGYRFNQVKDSGVDLKSQYTLYIRIHQHLIKIHPKLYLELIINLIC